MNKTLIVVEVKGGCVVAVSTNKPAEVEVVLRDFDNIQAGDPDPIETRPEIGTLTEMPF